MDCTDFTWNRYLSLSSIILHVVPQGSILGPLVFILHINELPLIFQGVNFVLYAYDTNILAVDK
jgi:mannose/fructose/N-acetylgalactosamine-specific phosphotransferase system component IID